MGELALAAGLLAVERVVYIWIARDPDRFRRRQRTQAPSAAVDAVRRLFCGFKVLQAGVFAWWMLRDGYPIAAGGAAAVGAGLARVVAGQVLNAAVFRRLGPVGTFYGAQFGYALPRVTAFPFSWFRHPQYLGTVLSIWGLFLVARYPADDWYALPVIETIYYTAGATFER